MALFFISKKHPNYKPLVLRVNDVSWLNAIKIFFIIVILTVPVALWLETPIASPIQLAYSLALTIYLVKKHELYLDELKPCLTLSANEFKQERRRLSHFYKRHILGGIIIAPLFFLFVNWRSEELHELFSGHTPSLNFVWSIAIAILSWLGILQSITVVLRNILQFRRLGKYHTKINLLNTDSLNPYSMVGVSTLLLTAGSYSIVAIASIVNSDLLGAAVMSLIITLPISIFFLLTPILALHKKIKKAKKKELTIISKAIEGDFDVLKNSHLNLSKNPTQIDLILYGKFIEDIDEWPINNSGTIRLIIYFIIPVFAWVASSFVDRLIDFTL